MSKTQPRMAFFFALMLISMVAWLGALVYGAWILIFG